MSRRLIRCALAAFLVFGIAGRAAAATTIEQLIALSRAGLEDDILIALIETDGSRFVLTADDILALYNQGLSNRVIRAMQATARRPRVPPPVRDAFVAPLFEAPPTTQAIAPEAAPPVPAPPAPEMPAPQAPPPIVNVHPPAVHVEQHVEQRVEVPRTTYVERVHVPIPVYVHAPVEQKPDPPVYWGWGGERRPDSWDDGNARKRDK
jgi:hypothetical protein